MAGHDHSGDGGGRGHHGSHSHGSHSHGSHSQGGPGGLGSHSHAPKDFGTAFAVGITLNILYVAIEGGYGLFSGSLALLADAGHNLSDVFGLILAWAGTWLAKRQPTARRTYGFKRGPILAALGNAVLLLVAVGAITVEGVHRLMAPEPVAAGLMIWVAAAGIVVNGVTALLFMGGSHDVNIRGAFLHMVADTAVTVGVIVAALVIARTGWNWIDPLASLVIALVILLGTWGLLRESMDLAMDAVPRGIDESAVAACLSGLPGVQEVHDLHIWGMSTTEIALTAHLVRDDAAGDDALLARATEELETRFGIRHATLQCETARHAAACGLRPAEVV